ncbi:MAG: asparagine synthase-related protein [Haloarculaceae archaeon]
MTGLYGILGTNSGRISRLSAQLGWTGKEETAAHTDDYVSLCSVYHPDPEREQPATTSERALVWVYGDVWGFQRPGEEGYRSRRDGTAETIAEACARRYEEHGIDFAAGLNGSHVTVVYDRAEATVYLVTDRLGTRPVYCARPDSETLVFSTQIQALPTHPDLELDFDIEYLSEYFVLGSVGGIKTPLTGVEELPPSSITAVDLEAGTTETEQYWRPRFEPLDMPFSWFVDQLVDRFQATLYDRFDPDLRYGLLLSGGSDSRAILAGTGSEIDMCAYHTADWESREVRTAKRVARAAGKELRVLMRDFDTHERMLETTPEMMNFLGRFCEAHITEFADRLHDEVDVLVSGLGADTLFREHAFRVPVFGLGPVGKLRIPVLRRIESVDEFIRHRAKPLPDYLDSSSDLAEILERNITTGADGKISHHGIECRSVDELVFFDDFYPFSNKSDFFYHALNQMAPHWSPFFDNRLIDLALQVPMKYRIRRNLINELTRRLDEDLAAIPHSSTGVPLGRSFPADFIQTKLNRLLWKSLLREPSPEEYMTHGPWPDMAELIRSHGFVREALEEKGPLIDALPFLDREGAHRCYQDHLEGADNHFELYTLLSFLHMPIVEQMTTADPMPL